MHDGLADAGGQQALHDVEDGADGGDADEPGRQPRQQAQVPAGQGGVDDLADEEGGRDAGDGRGGDEDGDDGEGAHVRAEQPQDARELVAPGAVQAGRVDLAGPEGIAFGVTPHGRTSRDGVVTSR